MTATIGLSSGALLKAGVGVNSDITNSANGEMDTFMEQAEGVICGVVKYDVVTNWGTVSGGSVAPMIEEYVERSAAVEAITYDMSGYTTILEAEDMINVHLFRMNEIKNQLKNASRQSFMGV